MEPFFNIEQRTGGHTGTLLANVPVSDRHRIRLEFNVPLDEYTERVIMAAPNSDERKQFFESLLVELQVTRPWERLSVEDYSWEFIPHAKITRWRQGWLKVKTDIQVTITSVKEFLTQQVISSLATRVTFPGYEKPFTSRLSHWYKKC